jgi:hydroxypyruvate isomerase
MTIFSANLGFLWPELPLLARIDAAAKAGFPAIELHWPYDVPASDVRAACARHGLRLMGLNTPVGDTAKGEFGLGALPGREGDFAAAMRQSIDYAVEAGAGAIHVMAGVTAGQDGQQCRDAFIGNLKRFAPDAARHGLTLLLEAINPRDKPGYFYSRQDEAAAVIEAVGAPNLKLMFDVYHCGVAEGDITRKLERSLPLIGHVQIAAVPSRAEPDEGEVDYRHVFAVLARLGWHQPIGCEYRPRAGTDEGLGWRAALGVA